MLRQDHLLEQLRHLPSQDQELVQTLVNRLATQRRHDSETTRNGNLYEQAQRLGMLGIVKDAPADLSSNRTYLQGLGRE